MSLATLQQWLDRVEATLLWELTLKDRVSNPDSPTVDELSQRSTVMQTALDDASAIILAYRPRVRSQDWPEADLQVAQCVRLAMRELANRRVGTEYKTIVAAADAVIAFYEGLVKQAEEEGGVSVSYEKPCNVFTSRTLKGR